MQIERIFNEEDGQNYVKLYMHAVDRQVIFIRFLRLIIMSEESNSFRCESDLEHHAKKQYSNQKRNKRVKGFEHCIIIATCLVTFAKNTSFLGNRIGKIIISHQV